MIKLNEKQIESIHGFNLPKKPIKILSNLSISKANEGTGETLGNELSITKNQIIIYPIGDNRSCKMRIRYFAYSTEFLSVLSDVKDGEFKTYRIPFDYQKYQEVDLSASINRSTDMIINPNISCDFFNVALCFCLSGPPTYTYSEENVNSSHVINPTSINWLYEEQLTLEEVVLSKHFMGHVRMFINRFLFFMLFFITLLVFWEVLFVLANLFLIPKEDQRNLFTLVAFTFAALIQSSILFYSHFAITLKNFFNMCLCCGVVIFAMMILTKEIIRSFS